MKVTAETIQEHENPLAMEGHTYGLNHHRDRYTNWELSTKHPDYKVHPLPYQPISSHLEEKIPGAAWTSHAEGFSI
ncbi:MAG: hypothetical protein ACUVS3_12960 [Thermodesulfobacteriota bacterium]